MNAKLYKCNKLFDLYTQEEKDQIDSILAEFEIAKKEAERELTDHHHPEWLNRYERIANPFMQRTEIIHDAVKTRYILAFKGNESAILEDVQEILNVIDKKDFMQEIKIRKSFCISEDILLHSAERIPDPIKREETINNIPAIIKSRKQAAIANYWNCYDFLLSQLTDQIEALQYYGLPLSGLEELTAAKASEWYVRTDFTPQIPHTKQFKKLEKFYFLADPITAGIFNGKHVIKTSNFIAIIDFETLEGVKLSRELSLYEKFVWHAIVNLVIQDHHEILTLNQIYKAMGNNGKPNEKTKKEILDAVENISRVRVSIDIPTDKEIYPGIDKFKGSFQLLATNTKQALSRGQIARDSIQILEEPQLFYFAKALNKVYSLPAIVLEVPISKTKANFTLLNYILQSILKLKKEEESEILLDALFVKCGIGFNDRTKKSRLLNQNNGTLRKILNHFAETKFIKKYEITTRKIKITF